MKARKRKKRRSSRTNNAPAPAVGAGVETARRAATARRKLAKRALHVGNVLLLLLTADWVLQETGVEAHRVVAVSAYMLQGAGALLLAFLHERPSATGIGIDASAQALAVAQRNSAALGLAERAQFREASWLDSGWADALGRFDLVLCNPPYVETGARLDPDVRDYEPASALFAGPEGLDDYRAIIPQLGKLLAPGGVAVLEIGAAQGQAVRALASESGYTVALRRDIGGRDRALILT